MSLTRTVTVAFVAGAAAGRYIVNATLSGVSAVFYQIEGEGSGALIAVMDKLSTAPVPRLVAAQFSSDGSSVVVSFSDATNRAGLIGSFPCARLLSFPDSQSATCQWKSAETLAVYPGGSSSIQAVGSSLTLLEGLSLRAECRSSELHCASYAAAKTSTVPITPPATLTLPTVMISTAPLVSGCVGLTVDLSASSGSGGRPWRTPVFEVTESSNDPSATVIASMLNSAFSFSPPTTIPSAVLVNGATYVITVKLCNFLEACAIDSATILIDKSTGNVPVAQIAGPLQRTITRDASVVLSTTAFTPACDDTKTYTSLQRSWSVLDNGAVNASIVSLSLDTATFRLPAFRLSAQHYYDIVFSLRNTATGLSTTTSTKIFVEQGPVFARISGGNTQSVALHSAITIDASASVDSDLPGLRGSAAGLVFAWTCVQTAPVFDTKCPLDVGSTVGTTAIPSIATPSFYASESAANTTAMITVTVSDAASTRTSTASVVVRAIDVSSPVIALSTGAVQGTNLNTNNALLLTGLVTAQSSCTAQWTSPSSAVVFKSRTALTPLTSVIPAGSSRTLSLLIAANALPVRSTLAFLLSCGQSVARIEVTTNGPPLPGKFTLSPLNGTEMTDLFLFAASFWSDPHLPLSYQFSLLSDSNSAPLVLQGRSELSFGSSMLPAGPSSAKFTLSIVLKVFDALSAMSNTSLSATILPKSSDRSMGDVAVFMQHQLQSSSGSTDATRNAIALGGALLNTVSCVGSPLCASLHRQDCARVQDTCGPCLAGFLGEAGDRNSRCVQSSLPGKAGNSTAGRACVRSSDCSGWEECAEVSKTCMVPQKTCMGSCAKHGTCTLISLSSQSRVKECKQSDTSCVAVCECSAGFGGPSCSLPEKDLQKARDMRNELFSSLAALSLTDDTSSEEAVAALSGNLAALSQDPYSLSQSAMASINAVASTVLSRAVALSDSTEEVVSGVLIALNAAADANLRMADRAAADTVSLANQALSVITEAADLVAAGQVAGQGSTAYVYDNFRITALRQTVETGQTLTASAPRSELEVRTGTQSSSVSIGGSAVDQEEYSVSLVTTIAAAYGRNNSAFHSNPLRLQLSRTTSAPTVVRFKLVHSSLVEFTNASHTAAMMLNSSCTGAADTAVYVHTCPVSGKVLTHNCTGLQGVMTSFCPTVRPVCSLLNTETGTVDSNSTLCIVTHYDATVTECTCKVAPTAASGSRRRLSGAFAQSGLLDVVSSSVFVASEFADTFNSADDFNSVEDLNRVLIVIVMFSTLWAAGLLLIFGCAWRRQLMQGANLKAEGKLERKMQSAQVSRSPAAVRQYLADYVVAIFPSVFSNKPFLTRLYGEIKRHHRYLRLITAPEGDAGDKERIITGIHLLTVQTMLMFLLSLLYDVQSPTNDGSCELYTDEADCVARTSPFDASQTYCEWIPISTRSSDTSAPFECAYQEPYFTLQVVIYIAVLVALLVAVIQYPVDRIFDLLSAPLADDFKIATQDTTVKRIGRRISNAARRASNVALGMANAARTKLNTARSSIVGVSTRKIPGATEAAHALAAASITVIAASSMKQQQERQLARMRVYYETGGGMFRNAARSNSEGSSSSDSDSSDASGSDSDDSDGVTVRKPERTRDHASHYQKTGDAAGSEDIDLKLKALSEELSCQRRLLKSSELDVFDAQWGMDPTGEFALGEPSSVPCLKGKPGAKELIRKELQFVGTETASKVQKLKIATDKHAGLEILHLFIKDLLGRNTPAARIFETKCEEDFEHTKVVSRTTKRLAVAALVLMNAFFVYYAMLTGFRRGLSWQRMFLAACIVQFFVEIFLFETMECVWINCMVPALVSDEVRGVGDSIIEVVQQLCASSGSDPELFLNAPDYLFVSTNVAKKFPQLMESILVLAYFTHLPGELSKTWQVGSIARWKRRRSWQNTTLLAATLTGLQYLGTAPFILHRMFVRFLQPFVLSGLVLLYRLIISDPVLLGCACGVLVLVGLALWYWTRRSSHLQSGKKLSDISPELPQASPTSRSRSRAQLVNKRPGQTRTFHLEDPDCGAVPPTLPPIQYAVVDADMFHFHESTSSSRQSVRRSTTSERSLDNSDSEDHITSISSLPVAPTKRCAVRDAHAARVSKHRRPASVPAHNTGSSGSSGQADSVSEISTDVDNDRLLRACMSNNCAYASSTSQQQQSSCDDSVHCPVRVAAAVADSRYHSSNSNNSNFSASDSCSQSSSSSSSSSTGSTHTLNTNLREF